eukprot:5235192-Prymnesium_polylepis.2
MAHGRGDVYVSHFTVRHSAHHVREEYVVRVIPNLGCCHKLAALSVAQASRLEFHLLATATCTLGNKGGRLKE